MDVLQLMVHASLMVKLVLVLLLFLSVVSWAVIVHKHTYLSRASKETATFMHALESGAPLHNLAELARTLPASPLAGLFLHVTNASTGMSPDRMGSSLARATTREVERLHAHLMILATTGSSAPFIGLFGTVWGIVHSFQEIGAAGTASLAVVAPGIAEALVATAAGLAVAIPAVAAYNHQMNRVAHLAAEVESVATELPGIVSTRVP
jgi:biopolymer transport protein TolQ